MATHSSILAWRIPWEEKPGRLESMCCKESDMTEQLTLPLFSAGLSTQLCPLLPCTLMALISRLFCRSDSPGKSTGVCSHSLLQGIFLTQGLNQCLLLCRQILYHLSQQGSPQKFQAYVKILKIKKLQNRKSKKQENFASFSEKLKGLESSPSLSTIISSSLKVLYFVLVLYTKFKNVIFKLLSD